MNAGSLPQGLAGQAILAYFTHQFLSVPLGAIAILASRLLAAGTRAGRAGP